MKQLKFMLVGALCTMGVMYLSAGNPPQKAPMVIEPEQFDDNTGIAYYCTETNWEAYIRDINFWAEDVGAEFLYYGDMMEDLGYDQSTFTIVQELRYTAGGGISMEGETHPGDKIFKLTGIGENGLKNATIQTLVFKTPSNLRYIAKEGMSQMVKLSGKLELPESLEEIGEKGLYSGDEGGLMPVTELVLPSTLKSLGANAIVLNQLTKLEFKSMNPPSMATVLPWVNPVDANYSTSKDIEVVVPQDAWDTYKATPGIGDYFSCFKGDDPTGVTELENAPAKACKVMRNGQLLIQKAEVLYTAEGKVVEK